MAERATANFGIALQAIAFLLAWTSRAVTSVGRPALPSTPRIGLAAILLLCAASLMFRSMRTLGPQWSIQARTLANHRLITTGPYAGVRHPIYLGIGLFLMAASVVAATWWAFVAALGLYVAGSMLRIQAEDRLLASRFGQEFENYRQRVPALLPWRRSA
jgi:protein-S-isoprenylcysteine O-methyltransferase Ste14